MIKKGEYVGYQAGSLVAGFLKGMIFDTYNFRTYSSLQEYEDALSRGSRNGGAAAIVDEIPYLRLLLNKYCHKYAIINPTYETSGFGFAFRKGSPLVFDVSTAILNLRENGRIDMITRIWIGAENCSSDGLESLGVDRFTGLFYILIQNSQAFGKGSPLVSDFSTAILKLKEKGDIDVIKRTWLGAQDCSADGLESLSLDRFTSLFLVAGISSSTALAIFFSTFLYENWHIFASSASIKTKLHDLARAFVVEKTNISKNSETSEEIVLAQSPLSIRNSCDGEGSVSQEGELSTSTIEVEVQEANNS